jgi:hypothetical protein
MKHITLATLLLAAILPAQAAVYTCKDASGRTTYTQDPRGKNCQTSDLGRPSVYSSVKPSSDGTTYTPRQTAYEGSSALGEQTVVAGGINNEQITAAQQRLQNAKQALEEGRKVRYGNERNYAKYLERISGLENAVKQAETELNNLSK